MDQPSHQNLCSKRPKDAQGTCSQQGEREGLALELLGSINQVSHSITNDLQNGRLHLLPAILTDEQLALEVLLHPLLHLFMGPVSGQVQYVPDRKHVPCGHVDRPNWSGLGVGLLIQQLRLQASTGRPINGPSDRGAPTEMHGRVGRVHQRIGLGTDQVSKNRLEQNFSRKRPLFAGDLQVFVLGVKPHESSFHSAELQSV